MEPQGVKVERQGEVLLVELLDEQILDELVINDVGEALFDLVTENSPVKMVLDFHRVRLLSSSMFGLLLRLHKRVALAHGSLKLCCLLPSLYETFALTKLNRAFDIHPDRQSALNSFSA